MEQKILHWLLVTWPSDMNMVMNSMVPKVSVMDHRQLILWVYLNNRPKGSSNYEQPEGPNEGATVYT